MPPVYAFDKLGQNLDRHSVFNSNLNVDYEGKPNCDLGRLDCRTSYNFQVAGKAPKKSPEWLKTRDLNEEKYRSMYYFAKESEDKTVLAQDYTLFYESEFLMQTIPLFDVKYSGELVYSKYSRRWQPIELFDRDRQHRSASAFLLDSLPPPPDRCLDHTRARILNNKIGKCSHLLLESGMLALMTSSSNWHWQDLLTVEVMVKPKLSGTGEYVSTKPIIVRRHVSNIMVLVPTEDRPELSLGNSGESAVLDSFAIDENAVQDRLEKYQDESISMSR